MDAYARQAFVVDMGARLLKEPVPPSSSAWVHEPSADSLACFAAHLSAAVGRVMVQPGHYFQTVQAAGLVLDTLTRVS